MLVSTWNCSLPSKGTSEELLVSFDQARSIRLLILPALFDEANKLRRQTVEVMRRLDLSGIDTFLPDLPGMNDSTVALKKLSFTDWQDAAKAAAAKFESTHVLTWRGGALIAPQHLPGWRYAPLKGAKQLRSMLRARTISAREAGKEEKIADLQEVGRRDGIELAGWELGANMFAALEDAIPHPSERQTDIEQSDLGGTGLWLRAEPDEDPEQADALAGIIAIALDSAGAAA